MCVLFPQGNHTVLQNLGLEAANPISGKASNSARGKGKRVRAGGARSVAQGAKKAKKKKTMLNSVRWVLLALLPKGGERKYFARKYPITQKQSLLRACFPTAHASTLLVLFPFRDCFLFSSGLQGDGEGVVARTRPAREAASKPKTYVEDSDGLDEEEDEDDAFVGEEEEEEEEEEEDVQIRSKRGRSRVG